MLVYRWGDRGGLHCCVCVMMCSGDASERSGVVSRVHMIVGSFPNVPLIYTSGESTPAGLHAAHKGEPSPFHFLEAMDYSSCPGSKPL